MEKGVPRIESGAVSHERFSELEAFCFGHNRLSRGNSSGHEEVQKAALKLAFDVWINPVFKHQPETFMVGPAISVRVLANGAVASHAERLFEEVEPLAPVALPFQEGKAHPHRFRIAAASSGPEQTTNLIFVRTGLQVSTGPFGIPE